jgi:hypothetical protein
MDALHSIGALVGRSIVFGDIRLGVCVDALLDGPLRRLVGLEVVSADERHRFLPFPTFDLREGALAVDSSLVLLEGDLEFYRVGGKPFSALRGLPVRLAGDEVGALADLLVDLDGEVRKAVVSSSDGEQELEPGPGLVLGNDFLRPAV